MDSQREIIRASLASTVSNIHFGRLSTVEGNVLLTHDRLLDELLSEDNALIAPLHALFGDGHAHANDGADHGEALVVEVAHDHDKTLVFFAQQILDGDLDVLELNKCRGSRGGVRGLDLFGLDTFAARNQEHREPLFGPAAGDKVVSKHAVGDPFPKHRLVSMESGVLSSGQPYLVPLTM